MTNICELILVRIGINKHSDTQEELVLEMNRINIVNNVIHNQVIY